MSERLVADGIDAVRAIAIHAIFGQMQIICNTQMKIISSIAARAPRSFEQGRDGTDSYETTLTAPWSSQ
jgi:hypothetical protein